MKKNPLGILLILFFFTSLLQAQTDSTVTSPLPIGEQVDFYSKVLDEERRLNVYLPQGYRDSSKSYPVIYLLDGSMDEDFLHISGLVQFASFSWIQLHPESIVVGISNVDRKRDFTYPTTIEKDKMDFPTTGESASFIQFIEEEVQPLVSEKYRISSQKTLIGQSLGGLLATEVLLKKPGLFTQYVIVSPSLWWDGESLLGLPLPDLSKVDKIHIAVGKEGRVMQRDAKKLYKKVKKESQGKQAVSFEFLKEQNHGDALHLAVYGAFEAFSR